eukprot:CAMPEP_0176224368 /NCGR_PEP_ID=MMETSP0121_2-20121125/21218_1 /TAXON_ID=160619 /ORGANISM="Kryptoperidinium foliaceum, Strain CCMP 1326" /LENGTH=107 /DNA_ID=CAMNT_0017563619 /DNA_START=65 /DNA_END=385 /DNA_ORIENTATION=+
MGKKRNAAAAELGEERGPSRKELKDSARRPSEIRISLKALNAEQLEQRWRALADEVREAQLKQMEIRHGTRVGRARPDGVPSDRARTNAMNAVHKAEQAYLEVQREW